MRSFILTLFLVASGPSLAAEADLEPTQAAASAADRGLTAELSRHRDLLAESAALDDAEAIDLYNYAFASYKLAQAKLMDGDSAKKERDELLGEARDALERVIEESSKNDPLVAEALSLQGGVFGLLIAESPMRGMRLGGRADKALERALKVAPENPRVLLQYGISLANKPKMFGGDVKKAESTLYKAVAQFASGEEPWPNWGRLDALAWLGQVLARQGRVAEARAAYQQALAIEPDMGWIRYSLLPELEKKAKAGQ